MVFKNDEFDHGHGENHGFQDDKFHRRHGFGAVDHVVVASSLSQARAPIFESE